MTKKKIARPRARTKKPAPKPAARVVILPAETPEKAIPARPNPDLDVERIRAETIALEARRSSPFDGDSSFHGDASVGDIVRSMFEAPNRDGVGLKEATFLRDVLFAAADDFTMLELAIGNDAGVEVDCMKRIALRANWRILAALELDARLRSGRRIVDELAAGGAS